MTTAHQIASDTDLKFKKIAVLTDFSKNADTALHYAAAFAREHEASLVLAHAYLPPACACAAPEIALAYQAFEAFRENLENRLLEQTEADYLCDIKCTILLREGEAGDLLEDLSDTDLIVVGTSGHTGLEKAALGSTAEKVFRSASIPVLTVGPRCQRNGAVLTPISTVLWATDLSARAAAALPYAAFIAREHDAELILLHVIPGRHIPFSFERAMASAEPLERLKKLVPDNMNLHIRPKYLIGFGAPDEVILEEAKMRGVEIIVVGAHKTGLFGSLARRFEDGTAYSVAVNAPCPVLTIRES